MGNEENGLLESVNCFLEVVLCAWGFQCPVQRGLVSLLFISIGIRSAPEFILVSGQFLLKLIMLVGRELVFPSCSTAFFWSEERLRAIQPLLCGWGTIPMPCSKGSRKGYLDTRKIQIL